MIPIEGNDFMKKIVILSTVLMLCGCSFINQSSNKRTPTPVMSKVDTYVNSNNNIEDDFIKLLGANWTIEDDLRSDTNTYIKAAYTSDSTESEMYGALNISAATTATEGIKDTVSYTVSYNNLENTSNSLWYEEAIDIFLNKGEELFGIDFADIGSDKELFYTIEKLQQITEPESTTKSVELQNGDLSITVHYYDTGYELEYIFRNIIKPTTPPDDYWKQQVWDTEVK